MEATAREPKYRKIQTSLYFMTADVESDQTPSRVFHLHTVMTRLKIAWLTATWSHHVITLCRTNQLTTVITVDVTPAWSLVTGRRTLHGHTYTHHQYIIIHINTDIAISNSNSQSAVPLASLAIMNFYTVHLFCCSWVISSPLSSTSTFIDNKFFS